MVAQKRATVLSHGLGWVRYQRHAGLFPLIITNDNEFAGIKSQNCIRKAKVNEQIHILHV
ncbi:hypothetical protein ACP6JC_000812 [Aspergillus fumigatus]